MPCLTSVRRKVYADPAAKISGIIAGNNANPLVGTLGLSVRVIQPPPDLPKNERAAPSRPPRGEEVGEKAIVLTPLLHNSLTPKEKTNVLTPYCLNSFTT